MGSHFRFERTGIDNGDNNKDNADTGRVDTAGALTYITGNTANANAGAAFATHSEGEGKANDTGSVHPPTFCPKHTLGRHAPGAGSRIELSASKIGAACFTWIASEANDNASFTSSHSRSGTFAETTDRLPVFITS